ncbi:MAG: hypothetical protein ACK5TN_15805 [Acidobacteriota bacterium]
MSEVVLHLAEADSAHDALWRKIGVGRIVRDKAEEDSLGRLIRDGTWPGIRRPANRTGFAAEVASASNEPWVDANGYLVEYWRSLDPGRPVWLAPAPPEREDVKFADHSLELALIEARLAGGNCVLRLPKAFSARLFAGESGAAAAWTRLGETVRWLRQQQSLFGLEPMPNITALVEPGLPTREIANLLHRRGASPYLQAAARALPTGHKAEALVGAGVKVLPPSVIEAVRSGAMLVWDQPAPTGAELSRQDSDRNFYTLGQGRVVSYTRRIADPSEFALDVIDLITHKRRAARIWNASSVIAAATRGPVAGEAILRLVNYGAQAREDVQAHVFGHYARALLLRPGQAPEPLKTARRGASTEVFLPVLERVAIVRFSNRGD